MKKPLKWIPNTGKKYVFASFEEAAAGLPDCVISALKDIYPKILFSLPNDPDSWEVTPLDAAYCAFELPESSIDLFDRMTKEGFRLDLVKGEFYK